MEPINVGVILQASDRIDFKLSPHTAKRKDIDTDVFRSWRMFFAEEISGKDVPFFQPPKSSEQFLQHLANLCDGAVLVTRPLAMAVQSEAGFDSVLADLYDRLVAPTEHSRKERSPRPTTRFREIEDEKEFRKRGLKRYPYVPLNAQRRWSAYRQLQNGENIVIDKVEVGNQMGLTADEIQKLAGIGDFLSDFLGSAPADAPRRRYVLLADQLNEKFTDQSDDNFGFMREEYDRAIETVKQSGGELLRKPEDVAEFAEEVDKKLPQTASTEH